jgi:hypothetical protein
MECPSACYADTPLPRVRRHGVEIGLLSASARLSAAGSGYSKPTAQRRAPPPACASPCRTTQRTIRPAVISRPNLGTHPSTGPQAPESVTRPVPSADGPSCSRLSPANECLIPYSVSIRFAPDSHRSRARARSPCRDSAREGVQQGPRLSKGAVTLRSGAAPQTSPLPYWP